MRRSYVGRERHERSYNQERGLMFAVHCPQHGSTVLLDVRRVTRLTNLADGLIAVELKCYDGERLVLMTGARATQQQSP